MRFMGRLAPAGNSRKNPPTSQILLTPPQKPPSDHLVRAYGNTYHLSTCISHCSNNYGPYQHPEKLIPLTIQRCVENRPIPIYGNGTNVRDWLFVDDHVKALHKLLLFGKSGETYAIGGDEE